MISAKELLAITPNNNVIIGPEYGTSKIVGILNITVGIKPNTVYIPIWQQILVKILCRCFASSVDDFFFIFCNSLMKLSKIKMNPDAVQTARTKI